MESIQSKFLQRTNKLKQTGMSLLKKQNREIKNLTNLASSTGSCPTSGILLCGSTIAADDLAKDVSGAEALLERHQEHKSEIDARENNFWATAEAGKILLESGHYASGEIKERLLTLDEYKNALLQL